MDSAALKEPWTQQVTEILQEATLEVPAQGWAVRGGREGYHTEYLGQMLNEMQSVHRAFPGQKW